MKGGGEGRVRRDEKRAPLKTPSWKASETAEVEPIQDQFSRICGEVKKRAAWALGTGSTFSRPSLLYLNRQDGRRVSSLQHILGHVCRFIVQERIKEHSPQEWSSMLLIY